MERRNPTPQKVPQCPPTRPSRSKIWARISSRRYFRRRSLLLQLRTYLSTSQRMVSLFCLDPMGAEAVGHAKYCRLIYLMTQCRKIHLFINHRSVTQPHAWSYNFRRGKRRSTPWYHRNRSTEECLIPRLDLPPNFETLAWGQGDYGGQ